PDPVEAAQHAEAAGAHGITVHLRGDRRHIQDADVERLRASVRGRLNLEVAAEPAMIELALAVRPDQVTLVPERPGEMTTEGGLDLRGARAAETVEALDRLRAADVAVSLFLDPDPAQLEALLALGAARVAGFEINTDAYTQANAPEERTRCLDLVRRMAFDGAAAGLHVYAGHGLTVDNVGPIAAIAPIEELNIGHALVSRSVIEGIGSAVRGMLAAMAAGRASLAPPSEDRDS
ncbi:MAG: pyridoxine 5'-phosphate synthase, partial [Acidobacteriota bacterium]